VETAPALSTASVLYLYGFVSLPVQLPAVVGVEENGPVFLVEYADIGCAVSLVAASAYQRDDRSAQEHFDWVTPRAWRHHDVVQRLHASTSVLPLKFGTLCPRLNDLRTMLRDRHVAIGEELARIAGKDEWTLRVTIDRAALAEHLQASEPVLIALKEVQRRLSEGPAYFAGKELQQATSDLADVRLAALENQLFDELLPLQLQIVPLDAPTGASADPTRLCITHAALLVERSAFNALELRLAAFEVKYRKPPVTCELLGPWPPYSFAGALESLRGRE
jgi:Gas vesicle synthesis protein GvpL/GvpF